MRIAPLTLTIGLLTGCGGITITGQVTDVTGAPLEGGMISVLASGTRCQTTADAEGRFSLGCTEGEQFDVAITQTGYVSKSIPIDGTQGTTFDLGAQALIKIPESDGLFVLQEGNYTPPERGLLLRNTKGPKGASTHMAYCLDVANSKPNVYEPGQLAMYAKRTDEWRVWKLDDEGCAYRKERLDTRWKQTYGEKAEVKREEVQSEQELVTVTLEPGANYVIADWHAGFFNEKKGEYEDDRVRYGGWWISTDPAKLTAPPAE